MTLNYFQSSVNQGKLNEEFYKPLIEKDINNKLNSNNEYNLFDFENDNYKIELKCREVERMKYKTTIVGYDKIEKGLEFLKDDINVIIDSKEDITEPYIIQIENPQDPIQIQLFVDKVKKTVNQTATP